MARFGPFTPSRPATAPARADIPTRAALCAFLYGGRIGPLRAEILRFPDSAIALAVADLRSDEAARFLAQLPAARQIGIVTALNAPTRARLAADCADWRCIVPILAARLPAAAHSRP